jgi:serine phosphatase RsbU (regulator of sigma subunit)
MDETSNLRTILDATTAIGESMDISDLLQSTVEAARALVHAERGTLYVVDAERAELWSTVLDDPVLEEIRLPMGKGIAGTVAQEGQPILINDAYADARFYDQLDRESGFTTRNVLCVPLKRPHSGEIVGVLQLLNKVGGQFNTTDADKLLALAGHVATTLHRSLKLHALERRRAELQQELEERTDALIKAHEAIHRQNVKIERELDMARLFQTTLLPEEYPPEDRIRFASSYEPSSHLSGDFYDMVALGPGRLGMVVVDVVGHGVIAAMVGAMFKMAFRCNVASDVSPADLLGRMNRWVMETVPQDHRMVTAVYADVDLGHLTIGGSVAGHPLPRIFRRSNGLLEHVSTGDLPLGIIREQEFHEVRRPLDPGDRLLLITDGLYEARDAGGNPLGAQRIDDLFVAGAARGLRQLVRDFLVAHRTHRGPRPQEDDVTIVLCEVGQY